MQIIRVEYIWTKDRLMQAMKNHSRMVIDPLLLMFWNILIPIIFILFVWVMINTGTIVVSKAGALLILLGFAFHFFIVIQKSRWVITRKFAKQPGANAPVVFKFSPEKIKIEMENLAYSELMWPALIKVAEPPEGFLLYHSNQLFHWVPFESFENENDIGTLREMAINSGAKFESSAKKWILT